MNWTRADDGAYVSTDGRFRIKHMERGTVRWMVLDYDRERIGRAPERSSSMTLHGAKAWVDMLLAREAEEERLRAALEERIRVRVGAEMLKKINEPG